MQLSNKITMKSIGCQPVQGVTKPDKDGKSLPCAVVFDMPIGKTITPVARVFGRAATCKSKTSDFGESFQFNGNFEATRLSDGESFRSSKLFLPKVLEGLMADALQNSEEALDFVVEIGVKESSNAHHYEWTVKPLIESKTADNLAHLRSAATANLPPLLQHDKAADAKQDDAKPSDPKHAHADAAKAKPAK